MQLCSDMRHGQSSYSRRPSSRHAYIIIVTPTCCIVQEVNSVEAIKNSVEANLGVAFVSATAICKETELGRLRALRIRGVSLLTDLDRHYSAAHLMPQHRTI